MASKSDPDSKDTITQHIEYSSSTPPLPASNPNIIADKAAEFLSNTSEPITFTYEEEKAVLRRIDLRLLPLLLGAYFFQQLDKSSLSYVSIFGLTTDAHLVGKQYSWLGSILYLAQLVMQPLVAFLLVKLPTGKVIGTAVLCWGTSLAIMSACKTFPTLLGMRFLLGAFEAFIAPTCVAVTQMWWRRSEQTLRTSYWNAMNGITSIVGSLFTYGLGHIHSKTMFKYQVIFLFCGLLTVAFSGLMLVLMPDSAPEAKYLTEMEKVVAVERLRANQMGVVSRTWRWDHVVETLLDLKTWCWFVLIVAISIASGGISTFGNLIVRSFGYTSFQTILFNIPFGVIQFLAILGSGWLATKLKRKGLVIAIMSCPPVVGAIMMLTVPRHMKGVLLFGYYLVSIMASITPLVYAWQAQNTGGDTKRKCTSAVVFIGMCTGNVIGPLLYSTDDAPLYRPGLISNLVMFALVGVLALLIPIYLLYLNNTHSKRRSAIGKSAVLVDKSMVGKENLQASKSQELESGQSEGSPQGSTEIAVEEDNGLADVTDLKNEDFIFVY